MEKLEWLKMRRVCEKIIERKVMNCIVNHFYEFEKTFKFITDLASTMARIDNYLLFATAVPYSQKWVGCISHHIDTSIKNVMVLADIYTDFVRWDIDKSNTVVALSKNLGFNVRFSVKVSLLWEFTKYLEWSLTSSDFL